MMKFFLSFSYVGIYETISSENFHRNLIIYTYLRQKNSDVSAFTQLSFPMEHFPMEMFSYGKFSYAMS